MARTPVVPGAAKAAAAKVEEQPTGVISEPVSQITPESVSPVDQSEQNQEPVQDNQLDQILKSQLRIETKIDRLLRQQGGSSSSAPKKMRWVEGKNGLEQQEI